MWLILHSRLVKYINKLLEDIRVKGQVAYAKMLYVEVHNEFYKKNRS